MARFDSAALPLRNNKDAEHRETTRAGTERFADLYEAHVDVVWRYAMARLGDRERARDVTSVTFERALTAFPRFQLGERELVAAFRSWLMTIARNATTDELRRHARTTNLESWLDLPDPHSSVEQQAVANDEMRRVATALAQLPFSQRRIVELRLIGMRTAEIAEVLDMSESAVNTAHFRAYARLRDLLAEPGTRQDAS